MDFLLLLLLQQKLEFHKKMYEIYPNKVSATRQELQEKLSKISRYIVEDNCGFRKNNKL